MSFPKISIIVPSYNQGPFLEKTLTSVISQKYPNLELFVIDGGSKDDSVEIIRKYESDITWWTSEKDKGQSDAINKGFQKATGEIINWINSDDLLSTGSLHKVAKHFSELPDKVGLIHGGVILLDKKSESEVRFNYLTRCIEGYLSGMVFSQPSAFFKKKYLDMIGQLNGDLHYGMDYDLFMRLSLVSEFYPVNDVLAKYRLHDQSKSVAESNKFISDWKKSFVNLCKNLAWDENLDILRDTKLFAGEMNYFHAFSFQPETTIVSSINIRKSLCFHLGHLLKDLYWNNCIADARKLMKMMENNFSQDWIKEDPRLASVMAKLRLPEFALKSLKTIKNLFKKK
jgi:glycosyltransferase involved in cell wall biosynthesis